MSSDSIRKEIMSLIKDGGYVCTTADVWTAGLRRFLRVTVSWVNTQIFMMNY